MDTIVLVRMEHCVHSLGELELLVEDAILRTPTGEVRNDLCDANIYLKSARDVLGKVLATTLSRQG